MKHEQNSNKEKQNNERIFHITFKCTARESIYIVRITIILHLE